MASGEYALPGGAPNSSGAFLTKAANNSSSIFGSLSKLGIPLPSITGGAAGPATSAPETHNAFGDVTNGFKIGVWGFLAIALTVGGIVWMKTRK